jgi:two-component system, OmpR family, response regulator
VARVVFIDDEPFVAEPCAFVLRASGHDVAVANDGLAGVKLVREKMPEVVVLDIRLPGATGSEVISMLGDNEATARIPVILISGQKPPDSLSSSHVFMRKPFRLQELLAAVERLAKRSSSE